MQKAEDWNLCFLQFLSIYFFILASTLNLDAVSAVEEYAVW